MDKYKLKGKLLNRSARINNISFHSLINILPKKDEILFGRKIFLEILLGLIKETQSEYLTRKKSIKDKLDTNLIKECLLKLFQDLKEIKEENEKKMKLYMIQKSQKEYILKDIALNTNIKQKRRFNSEILSISTLNDDDSYEFIDDYFTQDEQDFKTKIFLLENRIMEIDNKIKRKKFLIEFNKIPHKFKDHFIEYMIENKQNKQNVTDNLHDSLLNVRSRWKNIANKKNLQEMRLENIRTRIKNLKRESSKKQKNNMKYINTEDVIPEENLDNENFREEKKINDNPGNIKVNSNPKNDEVNNVDENNIKIRMKDVEKLLKLNMNINVNINLNKQYINNHYNNCDTSQQNKNFKKKQKKKY